MFVPQQFHLTPEKEKAEYDKHENSLNDQGYLTFLSRMYLPMHQRIPSNSKGIDVGCGPAPALANAMVKLGHNIQTYDLYYQPDKSVLTKQYDFVTCTEVIEHIANPRPFLHQLFSLIESKGYLGFMTKLVIDKDRFIHWHYKNDPTHICFYSQQTFEFIADKYQSDAKDLTLEFIGNDVIMFHIKSRT